MLSDLRRSTFIITDYLLFGETVSLKPIIKPSQKEKAVHRKSTIRNTCIHYKLLNESVLYNNLCYSED